VFWAQVCFDFPELSFDWDRRIVAGGKVALLVANVSEGGGGGEATL
jgi:hypothetical protein